MMSVGRALDRMTFSLRKMTCRKTDCATAAASCRRSSLASIAWFIIMSMSPHALRTECSAPFGTRLSKLGSLARSQTRRRSLLGHLCRCASTSKSSTTWSAQANPRSSPRWESSSPLGSSTAAAVSSGGVSAGDGCGENCRVLVVMSLNGESTRADGSGVPARVASPDCNWCKAHSMSCMSS